MNKKIIGFFIFMLLIITIIPVTSAINSVNLEKKDEDSNIGIYIKKGDIYEHGLKQYMGCSILVANWGEESISVNISIVINVYDISWKLLSSQSESVSSHRLAHDMGWQKQFFLQNNSVISFVKINVIANSKTLSKTGLNFGQFILFLI